MTTWHDKEPLDEALDFFVNEPPERRLPGESDYWLAISVGNPEWTATTKQFLEGRLL